ncbi:hypothetical protein ACH5RR_028995 [Cinchona calisaya]|uniref:Uncharacterized protein n=1 Tax=Cinchona calisaya TaxID=153742 RepID=A0ABD2YQE0_9GENT
MCVYDHLLSYSLLLLIFESLCLWLLPSEEASFKTSVFNNLKHLELLTGYTRYDLLGLETLLEKCQKLESMVLEHSDRDKILRKEIKKRPIVFHIPCLKLVMMKEYRGSKNELYVVRLLKKHRVALEKIVAFPVKVGETLSPPFVL